MANLNVNPPSPRVKYGYVIVAASFVILTVTFGMYFAIGIFFKPLLNEFGWTRAVTSGPIGLYMAVAGLLAVVMGSLTDKFGPRPVAILCGVLSGTGYLLLSQLSSIWQLYLFYGVLAGSGISILVPLVSTVARWFVRKRTLMTGIIIAGGGVGGLIMPPVANWLMSTQGWRHSFFLLGIGSLAIILIAALFLRHNPPQTSSPAQTSHPAGTSRPAADIEGLSLREAVRTHQLWLMIALLFCFGFSITVILVHLVPHATDINISAAEAAIVLSVMNGVSIIGRTVWAGMADKIGNKSLIAMTFILEAAAFFWIIYIQELWMLYIFAAIFGIAYGSGITQQSPFVARVFGMRSLGLILGIVSLGHTFGSALGGFLAGYIFDISGSYQLMFIICGIVSLIGLVLTTLVKPLFQPGRKSGARPGLIAR